MADDQSQVCVCSTRVEDQEGSIHWGNTRSLTCVDGVLQTTVESLSKLKYEGLYRYLFLNDSWNKVYDLSFIRGTSVGFNMPNGYNGSDTCFNRKLVLHTPKYSFVSQQGYVHVLYSSSAVHRKGKKLIDSYTIIVQQLFTECEKIGIINAMKDWLSFYLLNSSRNAIDDLYFEKDSYKGFISDVERIKKTLSKVNTHLGLPRLSIISLPSASLRVFTFVWRYCIILLPLYLYIHKRR